MRAAAKPRPDDPDDLDDPEDPDNPDDPDDPEYGSDSVEVNRVPHAPNVRYLPVRDEET